MSQFRHLPEKVAVGNAYIYEKSNINGSNKGNIAQYIASKDSLESFKWHEGAQEASLVTARIDWASFSACELKSWKVQANGDRILVATLNQVTNSHQVFVTGNIRSQKFEQRVDIDHYPWHSYDFDFASLNLTLPHLIDPIVPFTFGIADFDYKAQAPSFIFKGLVTAAYASEEERCGAQCQKYNIDGAGLENRGGVMWIDKSLRHIVDYEIDLPDEPGYESGKLSLKQINHMSNEVWHQFMTNQLA